MPNSLKVEIQDLQNLTSRVEARLSREGAELVEFHEDGLTFVAPPLFCSLGHKLVFRLVAHFWEAAGPGQPGLKDVELTAEVREIEGAKGEEQTVHVKLVQFDSHVWAEIHRLREKRQEGVAELFERLRKEDE